MRDSTVIVTGLYDDYYHYMKNKRIYISKKLIADLGKDTWNELLKEFVGSFTVDKRRGIAIDSLYVEMTSLYPHLFSDECVAQSDQLICAFDILRKARIENKARKEYGRKGQVG